MSRSMHSPNTLGKEWWSGRPFSSIVSAGSAWTKWWKRKAHRIERREALSEARREVPS